jgi:hypothetical protein
MSYFLGAGKQRRVEFVYTGQPLSEIPRNITHLIIDSSIRKIPDKSFEAFRKLVEVQLQEGLEVIGKSAFKLCTKLTKMDFPSTLREIGDHAFCMADLRTIKLTEGLQKVGAGAFRDCQYLREVLFSSSTTEIRGSAFAWCTSLISLTLVEGIEAIEAGTFYRCDALTSQRIPPSITKLVDSGSGAFEYCSSLLSVELSKEIRRLGKSTSTSGIFQRCESLVNIALPLDIEFVGPKTFDGCVKLDEIFPDHDDLVNALKHRFDDLPLHELCYYHSYQSSIELVENLRKIMVSDPGAPKNTDVFGMTPFHIIALSDEPNLDLLRGLLEVGPSILLDVRDKWGRTTWDYLCLNDTSFSAIEIELLVMARVQYLGLERWRDDVYDKMKIMFKIQDVSNESSSSERQRSRQMVLSSLRKYEQLEVTSLLESVLWKLNIVELSVNSTIDKDARGESPECQLRRNRESCRVNCGSNIVIPNVLAFLYYDGGGW